MGSGPLEEEVRARAAGLGIAFRGAQPHSSIGSWFQAADIVVVPSLNEPFGLVIIEALAAGTPVIASRVDDVPTIVRHGENGLLARAGDPDALADAIESLAHDRALLRAMQRRARSSVLPRFSWEESGRLLRDAIRARLRHNP